VHDGPGMRLRRARWARGFSQQQIADRAGISRQAISAIETGITDPSLRAAFALARALDTTIGDLFGTGNRAAPVPAAPVAPPGGTGARVTLAPMGTGYVALPLRGRTMGQAGFLPASGLADGPGPRRTRAGRPVRPIGPAACVNEFRRPYGAERGSCAPQQAPWLSELFAERS
jgi:DNA-binding XRE family transcriptional regulator